MPRGYSTVMFIGGRLNGETIEMPINAIKDEATSDSPHFFGQIKEGKVPLFKGDWRSSKVWMVFSREIYTKSIRKDKQIIYTFTHVLEIDRCSAKTQKGTLCLKEALQGIDFCHTHKKNLRQFNKDVEIIL